MGLDGRHPFWRAAFVVCVLWSGSAVHAQLQHGTIQGTLVGPDGTPIDVATVTLLDPLGERVASVTASGGRFRLTNVAPGTYSLRAEAPPLQATLPAVTVAAALPVTVELRLSAVAAEQVLVRAGEGQPASTTTRVTLAGNAVRRAPARIRARGLQDAIATTPGWSTEDNGLLHVRGVDDGFLYVIDGVPVYERLDGMFGVAPDPAMIDTVHVMTGYVPAEFGFKAGGVIEVRSAARSADTWSATLDAGLATDAAREFSGVAGGPIGRTTALTFGLSGMTSSRFLDPVHPDNLHNNGSTLSGGGQFGWNPSAANTLTAVGGFGWSDFDVPHGEAQEELGQDQRQRLRSHWQTLSWQRAASANTTSHAAAYHRFGSSALAGSSVDSPLFTDAYRTLHRLGGLASVTHQRGRHLLKAGGEVSRLHLREDFSFAVTDVAQGAEADLSEAALTHTLDRPFIFHDAANATLLSVYLQDSFRATDRLTIDLGIRGDWINLMLPASQWSPRAGVAYRVPATRTVVRGSVSRFFQPPQAENILLSSSEQARVLSPFVDDSEGGGAELTPERTTAFEVAVDQALPAGFRVDVAYWRRRITSATDPNVFFGTTIVFPNTVAKGRASGIDVRLESPRRHGWSSYLSYSNARVVQFGPVTGGLFLEDEIAEIGDGTAFTPDHDQRHVAAFGVSFDRERGGLSLALTGRYESGTPTGFGNADFDELRERPGADLVDFERGRVRPRRVLDASCSKRLLRRGSSSVDVRLAVLNVLESRWAYNFGNPFSGTHFGPGRTVQLGFRANFQ